MERKTVFLQNQPACSGPVAGWDSVAAAAAAAIGVFKPSILAGGVPEPVSPLLWRMFT